MLDYSFLPFTNLTAGKGNFFLIEDSSVVRSTDNGTTWSLVDSGLESVKVLFVVGNDSEIVAGTDHGVYLSSNDGLSWAATGLKLLPRSVGISDASLGRDSIKMIALQGFDTIFVSMNNGKSWMRREVDFRAQQFFPRVFAFSGSSILATGDGQYLFSTDTGISWIGSYSGQWPIGFDCLAVGGSAVLGGEGAALYRSTDDGRTWSLVDSGNVNSVSSITTNGTDAYAGTDGAGVLHSTDGGRTWIFSNVGLGIPNSSVSALGAGDPDIFAYVSGNGNIGGSYVSHDKGAHWLLFNIPFTTFSVKDSLILAGASGLYRSTNRGMDWSRIDSGMLFPSTIALNDTCIVIDGGVSALISNDGGTTWDTLTDAGLYLVATINALTICQGKIFAGTTGGIFVYDTVSVRKLIFSKCKAVSSGVTNLYITAIAASGSNLLAAANDPWGLSKSEVFISTNLGQCWSAIGELDSAGVVSFAIKGRNVFAASTEKGVFLSTDAGLTWSDVNSGLTNRHTATVAIGLSDVYLGTKSVWRRPILTDGSGVWRRPILEMTSVSAPGAPKPTDYLVEQNYPNPFNPTTVITYQIPKEEWVRVRIFDLLGREIRKLVDEKKASGRYSVEFNGAGLASGIYFCSVQSGNIRSVKKMVLLK